MNKILLFFAVFIGILSFAQQKNTNNSIKTNYTQRAEFPGGDGAFKKEFFKMVHAYIDLGQYAVNGQFTFIFNIDEKGKISNLNIVPKVKNSEMFIDDMQFSMKKVKTKWKPALKDNVPTKSNYILKINFTSDHFDHGD